MDHKMEPIHMAKNRTRRAAVFVTFTAFSALVVFTASGGRHIFLHLAAEPPLIRKGDVTLAYYRAPEHPIPPVNHLDPYDSFQKDADGDLIVVSTTTNIFSRSTESLFQGYMLRTHKGNPVYVYQQTPSRRKRQKSNCHGLTFLDGDYWLVGGLVEQILNDNNWEAIVEDKVEVGDVAVYRDSHGAIVHTAKVTGRDATGRVLVTSKNGFDLPVQDAPAEKIAGN